MLVTIDVTDDDLENGKCTSIYECAMALAAKRVIKANVVYVGVRDVFYYNTNDPFQNVPHNHTKFIVAFDSWKKGEGPRPSPFSFQIDIPKEYVRLS